MLRSVADARGIKAAALIHAARIAATGKAVSPGIFEVLALLGKPLALSRLRDLVRFLTGVRLLPHSKARRELQVRHRAGADLEVGEETVLVRESKRVERARMRARLVVLTQEHHRGSAALIHAPRAADWEVIEKFDIE